jgi:hypothetical protein
MTLVNTKQRYVSTTVCPLGKTLQVDCAALADRIFESGAAASAALVTHLITAECRTREQLARAVGGVHTYTHSYRLVYENNVADGLAA